MKPEEICNGSLNSRDTRVVHSSVGRGRGLALTFERTSDAERGAAVMRRNADDFDTGKNTRVIRVTFNRTIDKAFLLSVVTVFLIELSVSMSNITQICYRLLQKYKCLIFGIIISILWLFISNARRFVK